MSTEKRWDSKPDPTLRTGHTGIGYELYLARQRELRAPRRPHARELSEPCRCVGPPWLLLDDRINMLYGIEEPQNEWHWDLYPSVLPLERYFLRFHTYPE